MTTLLRSTISIPARFCGPPGFANGGYAAGTIAQEAGFGRAGEVTLLRPIPTETPVDPESAVHLKTAYLGDWVSIGADQDEAAAASLRFRHDLHPFPGCFVCGAENPDGLHIHPGVLPGARAVAAVWRVPATATLPTLWAALDCPSGWGAALLSHGSPEPAVLGRLAVQIERMPEPGETLVLTGWLVADQERCVLAGSALHAANRELVAKARATWVRLTPNQKTLFGVAR